MIPHSPYLQHAEHQSLKKNKSVNYGAHSYPSQTVVKAKLEMTEPGDQDEIEADQAASEIIKDGKISRKISNANSSTGVRVSSAMENQLAHMQGGGQSMPSGLQSMMETGFGRKFSQVRLHADSQAAEMSNSINAKAFTLGNDIYFNKDQYSPNTIEGQRLVAHELTHVIQGAGKIGRDPLNDDKNIMCLDAITPQFDECEKAEDTTACIGDLYDDFEAKYKGCPKIKGEIADEVKQWLGKLENRMTVNHSSYCRAVDSFYDYLDEIKDSSFEFNINDVEGLICTALGIVEVFLGKKGQAIIEVTKGAITTIAPHLNFSQPSTSTAKTKSELRVVNESLIERIINSAKCESEIFLMKEYDFSTQPEYKDQDSKSRFDALTSNYDIKRIGEETYMNILINSYVKKNLEIIAENDEENEESYYDKNEERLKNSAFFSISSKEHNYINKLLDTHYGKEKLPTEINTQFGDYNNKVRKKHRERALSDVKKGTEVIYYDKYKNRYEDDNVDSYYITNLNKILEIDGPDESDKRFNSEIKHSLQEHVKTDAINNGKIYYDKNNNSYEELSFDSNYITNLNKILEIDGPDESDKRFNSEIRGSVQNKLFAYAEQNHDVYYDKTYNQYKQLSGSIQYIITLNGILENEGINEFDRLFNSKIRKSLMKDIKKHKYSHRITRDLNSQKLKAQLSLDSLITYNNILRIEGKTNEDSFFINDFPFLMY